MATFAETPVCKARDRYAAMGFPSQMPETRIAGIEAASLWRRLRSEGHFRDCASQAGQDCLLTTWVFGSRRDGVFLDVGGYDGTTGLNTYFLERCRGWSGLLIEPAKVPFQRALAARSCTCLNLAVGDSSGTGLFLEVEQGMTQMSGLLSSYDPMFLSAVRADPRHRERLRKVAVRTLASILDEAGIGSLDMVSMDVEGGEMAALAGFPFDRVRVGAWLIENNLASPEIARFMAAQGYAVAGFLGRDEVYLPAGGRDP
ncbi:FkbM family methyltransferase [Meridianimarinicoccus roseus]|nr:FkbM family methyltransferase [Meridianimarinicoccus roseus]